MRGAGAIFTFGGAGRRGRCFIEALKVFFVAKVGDARSLAEPHSRLAEEARREAGARPEQIRVSIGTLG